jgi:hypothetical protein
MSNDGNNPNISLVLVDDLTTLQVVKESRPVEVLVWVQLSWVQLSWVQVLGLK